MAKTKHHQFIDTVDELFTDAIGKGIMHLRTENYELTGSTVQVSGNDLINFGSCSYMGLEFDERIKQGTIDAVMKYGSQFSASKAYISSPNYRELEYLIDEIFEARTLVSTSSSSGHIATIPVIVRDEDAIILDQQVHVSVQVASNLVKLRGVPVEIIRHSNLGMLEEKIRELGQKYKHIWYMVDGVYSMYGDFAPLPELINLLDKYEQLHLYVDDAHGMSWAGKHGRGYTLGQVKLHPKMVVATSMAKAFATGGGIFVFPDESKWRKVKLCGGPLTYSGPLQPPMIGASIASAKIHLSEEFPHLQNELNEKISYCNELIRNTELPLITDNNAPIFYIGMGLPRMGYNLIKKMIDNGFYVNAGIFPGVPVKCTGIRFTITRHHTKEQIKALIDCMTHYFPIALQEEQRTLKDIRKAFKKEETSPEFVKDSNGSICQKFVIEKNNSINNLDAKEWNKIMNAEGPYDSCGLKFYEEVFKGNSESYNNWDFRYYIARKNGKPLIASVFTIAEWKEDVFSPGNVSLHVEEKRKTDPKFLVSKMFTMGTPLSEGNHLYIDKSDPDWKEALQFFLDEVGKDFDNMNVNTLSLRDFDETDTDLRDFLLLQGFIKINLPEANVIDNIVWKDKQEWINSLSARTRRHFRQEIEKYEHFYEVYSITSCTDEELSYYYDLYLNVKGKNLEINTFDLPKKLFRSIIGNKNWDVTIIRFKKDYQSETTTMPVGIVFAYKAATSYCPLMVGMNYQYVYSHGLYRQILYRVVEKAKSEGFSKITLGFSASIEKKKVGAIAKPKVAYIQSKDNYHLEVLGNIVVQHAS